MTLKDKLLTAFPQLKNPESRIRLVLIFFLLKNRRFRILLLEFVSKVLFLSHRGQGGGVLSLKIQRSPATVLQLHIMLASKMTRDL